MSLTAKDVAQITRLLEESNFDELYLELDGLKLSLRRGSAANVQSVVDPAAAASAAAPGPTTRAAGPAASAEGPAPPASPQAAQLPAAVAPRVTGSSPRTDPVAGMDPNIVAVPAPLLGTFYRAPKPGAPSFVEIGSQVGEDTIVGIIEVMKLMNTVRAGVRGKVIQILARDGALVEYGETLLHVGKTG